MKFAMSLFTFTFALTIANVAAQGNMFKVPVAPCTGVQTSGQLLEVRISNCNQMPCLLRKGSTATIEIDYVPGADTNRVTTGAFGTLGGIPLPFIGTNGRSACEKIISKRLRQGVPACGLTAGEVYTYSNSFPILNVYPSTNVKVQWELIDGATRQKIVCWTVPSKIA